MMIRIDRIHRSHGRREARGEEPAVVPAAVAQRPRGAHAAPGRKAMVEESVRSNGFRALGVPQQRNARRWSEWPGRRDRTGCYERRDAIDDHGKMPDVVLYYPEKGWLLLCESVTSHCPVDGKRHAELARLFAREALIN